MVLHLYDASEDSLQRMKALAYWGVQDAIYFGGEHLQQLASKPPKRCRGSQPR